MHCLTEIAASVKFGPSISLRHGSLRRVVRRIIAIVIVASVAGFSAGGIVDRGGLWFRNQDLFVAGRVKILIGAGYFSHRSEERVKKELST